MSTQAKECLTVKPTSTMMGRTEQGCSPIPPTQPTESESVITLPVPQSTKPQGRRLLRVSDVAALCRVSRRTVYHWMKDNRIQWVDGLTHRYVYADSIPLLDDLYASWEP